MQISCVVVHVGVVVQPHQPHHQPPHHPDGAAFVVTVYVQTVPPIFNVVVIAELYEEDEFSLLFIVSQLYTIHDIETKSQVLLI